MGVTATCRYTRIVLIHFGMKEPGEARHCCCGLRTTRCCRRLRCRYSRDGPAFAWTPDDICVGVDWKPYPNATGEWSFMNHGDKRDLFSVLLFVTGGSFLLCGGILEKGGILGLLRYIYIDIDIDIQQRENVFSKVYQA